MHSKKALTHDKDGDAHYDVISAFQKSIRGSDTNAALHYMARLLEAGDLISVMRRLLTIAYEDIGLANPLPVQEPFLPCSQLNDWDCLKHEFLWPMP